MSLILISEGNGEKEIKRCDFFFFLRSGSSFCELCELCGSTLWT